MIDFENIVDQELVKKILSGALKKDKLAHAYLFYGEEGVGKWAMGLELAKAVNCENKKMKPCQKCIICKKISRLIHPDVRLIFPLPPLEGKSESQKEAEKQKLIRNLKKIKTSDTYATLRFFKKTTISVDEIREMKNHLNLKPNEGKKKVVIIKDIENLSYAGANSMLKVLEEPPGDSLLILTTKSVDRLLPTIVSRCQLLKFSLIPKDLIKSELEKRLKLSSKKASFIANISKGSLGKAIYLAQKEGPLAQKKAKDFLKLCFENDFSETIDFVEKVSKEYTREEVLELIDGCILVFKDLSSISFGCFFSEAEKKEKLKDKDLELLRTFFKSFSQIVIGIREAEKTKRAIEQNVGVDLALLTFLIKLKDKKELMVK